MSGSSVTVAAEAADDRGVTEVEFFVDGSSIGTDTTAPFSVSWDSTAVADGGYVFSATVTDTGGRTAGDGNSATVNNTTASTVHVGGLEDDTTAGRRGRWNASVTVTVHDASHATVANATVSGSWSAGANGSGSCTTDGNGQCQIEKKNISQDSSSVTFTVNDVSHATLNYDPAGNDDPGDSIDIAKP